MKSSGLTSAFGGNLAIMDIYAAQKMFGRGRKFDRIDLAVEPGTHDRRARARTRARCSGPGFQVEPPSGRGQQFEAMLAAYSMMVNISSAVRAVHRDVHHLQLVRDCGDRSGDRRSASCARSARRARQIRWLFLGESAVTGLIGSLAGVAFGVLIARGIAASIGTLIARRLRRGAARRRDRDEPAAARRARSRIGVATSMIAAADSRAQRGARRSGAGAAEGQVPGAVGGREPPARGHSPPCSACVSIVLPDRSARRVRCSTSAIALAIVAAAAARRRCCRWRWRRRCGRCSSGCGRWKARSRPTASSRRRAARPRASPR